MVLRQVLDQLQQYRDAIWRYGSKNVYAGKIEADGCVLALSNNGKLPHAPAEAIQTQFGRLLVDALIR
jgi:hypothetical protein